MATNSQVLDILHNALSALLNAEENATPTQETKIKAAIHVLRLEYNLVNQTNLGDEYTAISDRFKDSKKLIQGIIADQKKVIGYIQTAAQVVNALAPLVALL